eukprot:TRINITY_DN47775_c0_g1_i1.p1 TRINITY_DN47775_c0_g1~~TRINITY_DN47775_c0_g1_i1.p1  ORF type:complete len:403 (+),score=84.44 TRINITY_DN47775_c0_g1_i1:56-1210(+)
MLRRRRSFAVLKTIGISSLQAGRGADHTLDDDEMCKALEALSPSNTSAVEMLREASVPHEALEQFRLGDPELPDAETPPKSCPSPSSTDPSPGNSPNPSPHSAMPRRLSSMLPPEDREASLSDRNYVGTKWGALGASVHLEAAATKAKKNDAVDARQPFVRRSQVRAVKVCDADLSDPNVKVIHFLRHGEGTSNSAARASGHAEYKSPEWHDARLTEQGREQALDVALYVSESKLDIDLLVVSPLRRAAVTGCLAFHRCLLDNPDVPIIAHEMLRERAHGNPCDQRCSCEDLQREVPAVDYSMLAPEDPMRGAGEQWEDTARRSRKWLQWLCDRPERNIGVATHSAFLLVLFRLVVECDDELKEWFETGELRSVALVFPESGKV